MYAFTDGFSLLKKRKLIEELNSLSLFSYSKIINYSVIENGVVFKSFNLIVVNGLSFVCEFAIKKIIIKKQIDILDLIKIIILKKIKNVMLYFLFK